MSFRFMLVGPPGAGKGTQATIVSERLGIPAISTGSIFRAEIAKGSDIGEIAARYINQGNLVPSDVTDEIVRRRLAEPDAAQGFLLDGYPRNLDQVSALDRILSDMGTKLDAIVAIQVPDEVVVERLLLRAKKEGRADDTDEVIRHRIDVYHSTTQPIIDLYATRGLLVNIDGIGTVEEVRDRIIAAVRAHLERSPIN